MDTYPCVSTLKIVIVIVIEIFLTLTRSEVQQCFPLALSAADERDGQFGVGDSFSDQQGRCVDTLLHEGVIPHVRQQVVGDF